MRQHSKISNLVGTCFQGWLNVWNKTFENKSIAKNHRIPNKRTEQKIFELKYENTKLLGNTKYNQVKLVLAVFFSK